VDIDRRTLIAYRRAGEVWMATRDAKGTCKTMMVRPEAQHLQCICWANEYYVDMFMSFGCKCSVDQWLCFADALAWTLARCGVYTPHYVDDFIFPAGSKAESIEQLRTFDAVCKA
jgi:hypothetical protein